MQYRIKEFREKLKWTQEELAKVSGVSRATIAGLESGAVTVCTTTTLVKIAKALNKKVSDIIFEEIV